jgi:hypothetical protein
MDKGIVLTASQCEQTAVCWTASEATYSGRMRTERSPSKDSKSPHGRHTNPAPNGHISDSQSGHHMISCYRVFLATAFFVARCAVAAFFTLRFVAAFSALRGVRFLGARTGAALPSPALRAIVPSVLPIAVASWWSSDRDAGGFAIANR